MDDGKWENSLRKPPNIIGKKGNKWVNRIFPKSDLECVDLPTK